MSKFHPIPEHCPDAVPIKVNRVFDSCSDRDCLTNVKITLDKGTLSPNVTLVKSRCVRVTEICMSVEPVPFNRGFFSVDLTYTFQVELMAYERACGRPTLLTGTAYAGKNVILYGGESNSKTFFSQNNPCSHPAGTDGCVEGINLPTAAVQVVEPIALETKIVTKSSNMEVDEHPTRTVVMTLGLFSVVELFRPVTILVPTYEYTIPTKECRADTESPCAIFDKIRFPAEAFLPSSVNEMREPSSDCVCGCGADEMESDEVPQ
jgi:hypothetical protein